MIWQTVEKCEAFQRRRHGWNLQRLPWIHGDDVFVAWQQLRWCCHMNKQDIHKLGANISTSRLSRLFLKHTSRITSPVVYKAAIPPPFRLLLCLRPLSARTDLKRAREALDSKHAVKRVNTLFLLLSLRPHLCPKLIHFISKWSDVHHDNRGKETV